MIEEDEAARDIEEMRRKAKAFQKGVLRNVIFPSVGAFFFGQIIYGIFPGSGSFIHGIGSWAFGLGFLGLLIGSVLLFLSQPRGAHAFERQRMDGAKVKRLDEPMTTEPLVPIGHARMPRNSEPVHTLIEGAPGTGKTQILKQLVDFVRGRGDTVVVVDSNYDLFDTLGQSGDVVLGVFDERSPGWLPQNEIQSPADWSALAQSLIGNGQGESAQWHQMAQALFAAVGRGYSKIVADAGEPFDHGELFHLLTQASAEELAPFIKGTAAASLGVNEKALNNVRMTFFATLKFWEYLKPGDFSVRNWVEMGHDRPSIFIPYKTRELAESKHLISCWLDQLITTAIDLGENRENRVWVIIDELSGLGEISGLKQATAQLRKTGFCVVCGVQSFEQIEDTYGAKGAVSITNNMGNKVILQASDPTSAERQSKLIGDARFRVFKASESRNDGKVGVTRSMEEKVERLVLPAEIQNLAPLNAFVIFNGDDTTYRTPVPIYQATDTLIEADQGPKALPAPSGPTPAQIELQEALQDGEAVTLRNTGGEGPQPWVKVDMLLKQIGGESFKAETLEKLGWVRGQAHEKFVIAHERARQLLAKTLDKTEIEERAKQEEDLK